MAAIAFAGYSQENPLANVPTVPISEEKVAVSVGALMSGNSTFRNSDIVDYNFGGFFVGAEIITAAETSGVLQAAGLRLGASKSWERAKLYGFLGGRRNWEQAAWEGVGGVGVAYTPVADGVLSKFSIVTEQRIIVSDIEKAPPTETFLGIRYSF